jgi:hypothetical protein
MDAMAGEQSSNVSANAGYNGTVHEFPVNVYGVYEDAIYSYVVVTICVFGLVGNFINIVILHTTSAGHQSRMEKSAQFGLSALSVSDLLFCVATLPSGFFWKARSSDSMDVKLIYWAYSDAVINTFMQTSTWLTVMMAVSRYLAICHPFKARMVIGMKFTRACTCGIVIFCVLLNIPRYFFLEIEHVEFDGSIRWFTMPGVMRKNKQAETFYYWLYFVVGILLPLVILTFSNMKLLQTLRCAAAKTTINIRRHQHASSSNNHNSNSQRITLILVIIVIVYTLCLVPAEIANFIKYLEIVGDNMLVFNFILAVLNASQTMNFAVNVILYCTINREFRKKFVQTFAPCLVGSEHRRLSSTGSFRSTKTAIMDLELQPLESNGRTCSRKASRNTSSVDAV